MAKKIVIKDNQGNKKIKIAKEKPAVKLKIPKNETKIETRSSKNKGDGSVKINTPQPETKEAFKKYRISWDKVINTVNDDSGNSSELKVFVRIMAFDSKGKTILDEGKKNKKIIEWEKLPSSAHQIIPKPWTFAEGSENNPLELGQGKSWAANKWVEFRISSKEKKARFGIRMDAVEYDTSINPILLTSTTTRDYYEDNLWEANVSDIKKSTPVVLVIREQEGRLTFKFTVSPVD